MAFIPTLEKPYFSFDYDNQPFETRVVRRWQQGNTLHFSMDDGLEIIQTVTTYDHEACHWVLNFIHGGSADSGLITHLYDGDIDCPFAYDAPPARMGFNPPADTARVISTVGSNWERREFNPNISPLSPGGTPNLSLHRRPQFPKPGSLL